uniref:Uncharacterized protein n=1 Tax=Rhizophora mucronata TaxID=61149 RepID=A0A2P2QJB1_RHIMU
MLLSSLETFPQWNLKISVKRSTFVNRTELVYHKSKKIAADFATMLFQKY